MSTGLIVCVIVVVLIRTAYKYNQGIKINHVGAADYALVALLAIAIALLI
ncbi:hypothetical protein [Sphingobacterium paludis]|uniref:Uncharacterized protein n=1 Tax=Sphingobacterium paludis TaxID=1476465 RepID=A0A4R7D4G6_9SPHI|nr:hypothetical protein [Sphingobacterium paludis]TDS14565.1 hypothetical protein B0I21_10358 [Sphingobacterium paludis]